MAQKIAAEVYTSQIRCLLAAGLPESVSAGDGVTRRELTKLEACERVVRGGPPTAAHLRGVRSRFFTTRHDRPSEAQEGNGSPSCPGLSRIAAR
jgi:hypothetical protein